jgi:hypothetical protein
LQTPSNRDRDGFLSLLLKPIEEIYNTDLPLALYQNKFPLRPVVVFFKKMVKALCNFILPASSSSSQIR